MASRSSTENDVDEILKSNGKLYQALLNEEAQEVINMCNGLEDHALHELTIHKDTMLESSLNVQNTSECFDPKFEINQHKFILKQ